MDYFMPSDVARLVLGYLKENSYQKTFQCFLKECCHLQEFYSLVKAGRQPKQISQLNLIIILEEWGQFKFQTDHAGESVPNSLSPTSSCSFDTADETLVSDNDVTRKSSVKRSPKRKKKTTLVTKKVKSPALKSPKSSKSINVSLLSPRKLRSGKSVGKDGTCNLVDSPGRSSTKSSLRTQETPEKSATVQSTVVKKTISESRQLPSDGNLNQSPSKHVQFSGTTKTSEQRNCDQNVEIVNSVQVTQHDKTVCYDKNRTKKASDVESESVHVKDRPSHSEVLHRSEQDLTIKTDGNTNDGTRSVILSEALAKHDSLPPSESVGIADKCISWMNGNVREETSNRDPATAESQGTSSEYSSESNVKSCDTGDKSNNKHGQDLLPLNHEPIIPILKTPKKTSPSIFKSSGELITPVKLLLAAGEHHQHVSRSPRRKKPKTPRKRNSEVSPVSVVSGVMSALSVDPMFEKILGDHRLHQKLAETCNSIVQNQIKGNSGREKKDTTERISPTPTHISIDQETIAASKSLEEILEIDNNFHSEFLSDNFDMSDPAYESLFKLFGTDRETFSGYLRREKEKELAQMEAEVEELERSNHEILCANFGMSHADTSYDTDGLNSPHHVINSQDLFSSQPSTSSLPHVPGQATSTPCMESVPVNFTPLLRSHELGSSPVRSSSGIYSGVASACDKRTSPGSTTTQPFSPAFSHYSDMNPPPTPRSHPLLTKYINDPRSPRLCSAELPYSNPTTPQPPSSPHGSHLVHSTPTGSDSVRSQNYDHFYQSSPIHPTNSIVSSGKVPNPCSPLVKGDLQSGSPRMVQKSAGSLSHGNTVPHSTTTNSNLYFSSQQKLNSSNDHTDSNSIQLPDVTTPCFMHLLNDNHNRVLPTRGEPCSTIDNSIGCISLPLSSGSQHDVSVEAEKSEGKSRKSKGKKQKGKTFSTLKGLLSKPLTHRNSVPLGLTAGELHEALKNSEKRGEHSLTFHSPNGKSSFKVPILDCQNDSGGMGVLGMSGTDSEADHTIHVYNENLDSSREYSIAPENQATQDLVNAIKAGSSAVVLQEMQSKKSTNSKKKTKSEKKPRKKTKEKKNESTKNIDECEISGSTPSVGHNDLDPNQDVYTATPLTALSKATTVRALNFGSNPDDQSIGGYRKIFPKMPVSLTPSVLILNTNKLITPTQKVVVNTTPGTVNLHNVAPSHTVDSISRGNTKTSKTGKVDSTAESDGIENASVDVAMETGEIPNNVHSVSENKEDSKTSNHTSNLRKTRSRSKDSDMTKTKKSSFSKDNADKSVSREESNLDESDALGAEVDSKHVVDTNKDNIINQELQENVEMSDSNEQADNASFNKRITRSKQKHNKSREKLKVKLPVHKSPRSKKHDTDDTKACIPFYFKPKTKMESTENPPSAPLTSGKTTKSDKSRSKKTVKSVPIIIESESSEDDTLRKKHLLPSTPDETENHEISDKCEMNNDEDDPSSKELLLEKIGLTPKKNFADIEKVLRSPNRANALDVLAEWQSSPLNSRKRSVTPSTRSRYRRAEIENSPMKSPTTPKRKTPAKKLFTSPCKEQSLTETRKAASKSKSTAKRVSGIIDRLKLNNPDTRLPSPIHVAEKESEVTEYVASEFIDNNKMIDDQTNNTKVKSEHKNKRSKKNSSERKKKKKVCKTLIENQSDEESGLLNNEITKLETNNIIKNKSEAIDVHDQISGNSESVQKEYENSNSPVNSVDIETVNNGICEDANELDQAVASIASDHEEYVYHNSVNQEELRTCVNDNTEHIERYEYSQECSDVDEVDTGSVHLEEGNEHEVFDSNSSSHTIITKADIHVSSTLTEGLIEGNVDLNVDDDNKSDSEGLDLGNDVNDLNDDLNADNGNESDSDNFEIHAPSEEVDVVDEHIEHVDRSINVIENVNPAEHSGVVSLQSEGMSLAMNSVSDINEKINRKEKKKKRRHRHHKHRHRHTSNVENGAEGDVAVGDLFVTPAPEGDNEHKHRHHHKKKKRKSHKRHREDDEDRHHHKRHKKEKSGLSLDSLNVEEALSQIYK